MRTAVCKLALITSGGRGIGEGIAFEFAARGARIVVYDPVCAATRDSFESIWALSTDAVTCAGSEAVPNFGERFRSLDILVNDAGQTR